MKAKGTIETEIIQIIPFLLYISKSRITNGRNVDNAESEKTTGKVYSLHITPFFSMGIVKPFKQK
jgi:hypothetical protein